MIYLQFAVTTAVENTVGQGSRSLLAEHGLPYYIEAGDRKILFDAGQNLALSNNARVLGIPLDKIDAAVLSHGHYDHTGGLQSLLDCNPNFTLHAHPDVFSHKVKQQNGEYKLIGIPIEKHAIEHRGAAVKLQRNFLEIAPGKVHFVLNHRTDFG